MIGWILSFLSLSLLTPPLLYMMRNDTTLVPKQAYILAAGGILGLLLYFIHLGAWQVSTFILGNLMLYYFGASGIIAYNKSKVWLPSLINIAVYFALIFGWYLIIWRIDYSLPKNIMHFLLLEAILTGFVVLVSFFPVVSKFKAIQGIGSVWLIFSWGAVATLLFLSSSWAGFFLYLTLALVYLVHLPMVMSTTGDQTR